MTIHETLDRIRTSLELTESQFSDMPMGEVLMRLGGRAPYLTSKWTRGELASIVADSDGDAALDVLEYLWERGPRVIAWDDESDPTPEAP